MVTIMASKVSISRFGITRLPTIAQQATCKWHSSYSINLRRRGFASVTSSTGEPPLKGIRVLDMTRVLAGVSEVPSHVWGDQIIKNSTPTAVRHPDIRRPWVSFAYLICPYSFCSLHSRRETSPMFKCCVLTVHLPHDKEQKSSRLNILPGETIRGNGDLHLQPILETRRDRERVHISFRYAMRSKI